MTRDCVILQESSPRLSSTGTGRLCHGRPASLIGLPEAVAGSHQSRLTSTIGVFFTVTCPTHRQAPEVSIPSVQPALGATLLKGF